MLLISIDMHGERMLHNVADYCQYLAICCSILTLRPQRKLSKCDILSLRTKARGTLSSPSSQGYVDQR